jgi:AraC family transcriptional regulator of adaptative response / DNA-3-methyladenine glycosylase II
MNEQAIFERARLSRDARFDGRFFVGVRTTGIYCRPICPAVPPKSGNVTFYPTAAAASEAGFRPCLRCRPECAPGTPAWNGTSTTVRRGLKLIAGGALDDGSVEELAERLGVTSRHLRRLFGKHLGASPLAVAHTQRLHLAKRLVDQTDLPMSRIAAAAGFGSIRRFNDTFRKTYGRTPRDLRRRSETGERGTDALTVRLPWREPFSWPALAAFLAGRATSGVELVSDDGYLRTVQLDGEPAVIECRPDPGSRSLRLTLHGVGTASLLPIVERVRDLFDLDAPVDDISRVLGRDRRLARLLRANPGVRVPGAWDGFELAVRAILGQQISVSAATTLAGRLAARYGEAVGLPASLGTRSPGLPLTRLFPSAECLARARPDSLGIVAGRAQTIRDLARAVVAGDLDFDPAGDPAALLAGLKSIRGIGDWTAQYVAMRALKYPDAFPASDLGLSKATGAGAAGLTARAEDWRPWRAYAAMLLWGSLTKPGG